jgi:hypothetical protein
MDPQELQMDADEDEIERLALGCSPRFQSILDVARQQIREGRGIPHDDFWRDLEAPQREPDPTAR